MLSDLSNLTISYIFQDEYPWDIRVDKIVTSLSSNGAKVHVISRNRSGLSEREQVNDNLFIHRLPYIENVFCRDLLNIPAFFSPFWLRKIILVNRQKHCQLIIVRDLPLALTGILAGKVLSIPVLFDMAENYPAMIADTWKYRGPNISDYFLRNPFLLRLMERFVLPRFDGVMPVSVQSKDRICKMGVAEENVWVVGNTPRLPTRQEPSQNTFMDQIKDKPGLKLLYVGGLEESRGLEVVIDSLPAIREEFPDVLFIVVGEGSSKKSLVVMADRLGVTENVFFAGWMDNRSVPAIIQLSDVCVIPHYVSEHIDTTVPNKIFDYMLQKKPVLVTQSKSLCAIVEKWGCGLVYDDNDSQQLADRICELSRAPLIREKLGKAGYNAVVNKCNWAEDEKRLFSAVFALTRIA
jgi:glycosyltransferase involved in cell wall biosynthesis